MTFVELYTDGACSGNPGPGGWGYVLRYGEYVKKDYGYQPQTTNNRMELMAVLQGMFVLTRPSSLKITTDSQYVKNAFTEGWLEGWKKMAGKPLQKSRLKTKTFGKSSTLK